MFFAIQNSPVLIAKDATAIYARKYIRYKNKINEITARFDLRKAKKALFCVPAKAGNNCGNTPRL